MDFNLKTDDELNAEIETQILIVLLSSAWLASPWRRRELEIFGRSQRDISQRIFVVELDRIDNADKPDILHHLLTYRFWRETEHNHIRQLGYPLPQVADTAYYDGLADLSQALVGVLKPAQQMAAVPQSGKTTVYVAPVDDSLYEQRTALINELNQFGIEVLPHNNSMIGNMAEDLNHCSHFIQLLDAFWTMGIPCNQYAAALTADKPVLQWRDTKLNYNTGQIHKKQKKLLQGKDVFAAPLPDFIRFVREAVLPKPAEKEADLPTGTSVQCMVFIHAGQVDFEHARYVAQILKSKGYGIILPRYQGDAARIRKSIERGYQLCDVILMLQQDEAAEVVEDYLSEAQVQAMQRDTRPSIMICQSDEAEELYFSPPGMTTLSCCNNFDEHCLSQFLQSYN